MWAGPTSRKLKKSYSPHRLWVSFLQAVVKWFIVIPDICFEMYLCILTQIQLKNEKKNTNRGLPVEHCHISVQYAFMSYEMIEMRKIPILTTCQQSHHQITQENIGYRCWVEVKKYSFDSIVLNAFNLGLIQPETMDIGWCEGSVFVCFSGT